MAFSKDKYIEQEFVKLRDRYDIKTVIETGTYLGYTTEWLARNFENVITIEINKIYYEQARANLDDFLNIEFILGDSARILETLRPDGQVLYYLDAHWERTTPTPRELISIAELDLDPKPVIVIHDFQNPNNPKLGYDKYPDFVYRWKNIEKTVNDIYGGEDNYVYYYNNEAEGAKRGIIYITPI